MTTEGCTNFLNQQILELREQRAALTEEVERLKEFLRQRDKTAADDEAENVRLRTEIQRISNELKAEYHRQCKEMMTRPVNESRGGFAQTCDWAAEELKAIAALDAGKPADTVALPRDVVRKVEHAMRFSLNYCHSSCSEERTNEALALLREHMPKEGV